MENMDKKDGMDQKCGHGCMGGCAMMGHMCGCHGRHHLVKVILKIIIVVLIFWCGFKLGVITGSIRGGETRGGFRMMQGYNNYGALPSTGSGTALTPVPAQ